MKEEPKEPKAKKSNSLVAPVRTEHPKGLLGHAAFHRALADHHIQVAERSERKHHAKQKRAEELLAHRTRVKRQKRLEKAAKLEEKAKALRESHD